MGVYLYLTQQDPSIWVVLWMSIECALLVVLVSAMFER